MLQLHEIVKTYAAGNETVEALKGVSLQFRQSEFVSVLGPSGCGKTTLLNIIGGLDQYTSGDLVINGRSTKGYGDRDWDTYRNHSIGFVFQSYNLIPHQSVLQNVELALTLSGVSRAERRRRAIEALQQVGLGDQLHKKPSQMSGGQMQRVAIARALVNRPSILLADEPTGALDTVTSVQIMDLLKEIARDRLVIMVTHNPELAETYSTRIIRLLDGRITGDSDPYTPTQEELDAQAAAQATAKKEKKSSMSAFTAHALSLNNLMTKKTRTLLTSFAGSIGIIGIALILSLSNGIQTYIDKVQEDTLSSYPILLEDETLDMSGLVTSLMGVREKEEAAERADGKVYSSTVMYDLINTMNSTESKVNDLGAFKKFLETDEEMAELTSAVQYSYDVEPQIYTTDADGKIIRSDVASLLTGAWSDSSARASAAGNMGFGGMKLWQQMLPDADGKAVSPLLTEQYDLLYGKWPEAADELVLVISENNELSDLALYTLGMKSGDELREIIRAAMKQEQIEDTEGEIFTYEQLCDQRFRLLLPAECWQKDAAGDGYHDLRETDTGLQYLYDSDDTGLELRIVGIIRPDPDAAATMLTGSVGYTAALTDYVMAETAAADMVKRQQDDPATDIFNGLPFVTDDDVEPSESEKKTDFLEYAAALPTAEKASIYTAVQSIPAQEYVDGVLEQQMVGLTRADIEGDLKERYAAELEMDPASLDSYIANMSDEELFGYVRESMAEMVRQQYAEGVAAQMAAVPAEQLAAAFDGAEFTDAQGAWMYDEYMPATRSEATFEENMKKLGWADREQPTSISLYAATFADKDAIADAIARYNDSLDEDEQITYTDYVALLMSSITTIINAISYVLIAFVAISLVVSSIMIGIITYISVLERTKEIGILRAIGASKRDISRVFNAETLIVGFVAGAMGIGLTLLLNIPINAIVHKLTNIQSLNAVLPGPAAVILVLISMGLTVIAGVIPSRLAAKKDPVVALRSE